MKRSKEMLRLEEESKRTIRRLVIAGVVLVLASAVSLGIFFYLFAELVAAVAK